MSVTILTGDAETMLRTLPDQSVQCCVTSPPYFALRDYGTAQWEGGDPDCDHHPGEDYLYRVCGRSRTTGDTKQQRNAELARWRKNGCPLCGATRADNQIGLESTLAEYLDRLVSVFREVRRVLANDGVLWLNIGDSYATGTAGANTESPKQLSNIGALTASRGVAFGFKPKDLMMVPARLALALQADGWYLRSDIIWTKPNPMPESVTDRPTSAHEHIFLLSKQSRYYYDADAIRTPITAETTKMPDGWDTGPGGHGSVHRNGREKGERTVSTRTDIGPNPDRNDGGRSDVGGHLIGLQANARNVWTIATVGFPGAHFATFPPEIPRRCILAGSRPGDTILDPFAGAGTTGLVADRLARNAILIELNPEYVQMARDRIYNDAPMFADVLT